MFLWTTVLHWWGSRLIWFSVKQSCFVSRLVGHMGLSFFFWLFRFGIPGPSLEYLILRCCCIGLSSTLSYGLPQITSVEYPGTSGTSSWKGQGMARQTNGRETLVCTLYRCLSYLSLRLFLVGCGREEATHVRGPAPYCALQNHIKNDTMTPKTFFSSWRRPLTAPTTPGVSHPAAAFSRRFDPDNLGVLVSPPPHAASRRRPYLHPASCLGLCHG